LARALVILAKRQEEPHYPPQLIEGYRGGAQY